MSVPRYEHGEWLRSSDQPRRLPDDVRALFRYWAERADAQGAPSRAQIDPLTHFPRLMPTTMLLGVERSAVAEQRGGECRFRYRIVGNELSTRAGRELTGKYMDECFAPADLSADFAIYHRCIAGRLCYWGRRTSVVDGRKDWEVYNRIILPILDAEGHSVDYLWIYIWFDE
jgi:hypothetical protein